MANKNNQKGKYKKRKIFGSWLANIWHAKLPAKLLNTTMKINIRFSNQTSEPMHPNLTLILIRVHVWILFFYYYMRFSMQCSAVAIRRKYLLIFRVHSAKCWVVYKREQKIVSNFRRPNWFVESDADCGCYTNQMLVYNVQSWEILSNYPVLSMETARMRLKRRSRNLFLALLTIKKALASTDGICFVLIRENVPKRFFQNIFLIFFAIWALFISFEAKTTNLRCILRDGGWFSISRTSFI